MLIRDTNMGVVPIEVIRLARVTLQNGGNALKRG